MSMMHGYGSERIGREIKVTARTLYSKNLNIASEGRKKKEKGGATKSKNCKAQEKNQLRRNEKGVNIRGHQAVVREGSSNIIKKIENDRLKPTREEGARKMGNNLRRRTIT